VGTLVLWDIDGTLLNAAGFGWELLETAFLQLHGRPIVEAVPLAGRTDRAIATDLLARHGIEGEARVNAFTATVAGLAESARAVVADEIARRGGGPLPGAAEAIAALAQLPGVVQSVLSGNLAILGAVKLGGFRQFDPLDLSLAAFGDHHRIRADLVDVARRKFAQHYGSEPEDTVLIGDTPLDVEAAQASGARIVAVATGRYGVSELEAVGAPIVLPDLRNVDALLAALGRRA
jgi:phosphoglycolate phosphatase-like HAD superfamily hydrolase